MFRTASSTPKNGLRRLGFEALETRFALSASPVQLAVAAPVELFEPRPVVASVPTVATSHRVAAPSCVDRVWAEVGVS